MEGMMVWKALQLKTWASPKDASDVRVYINAAFVDRRDPMHFADGDYLKAGADGEIVAVPGRRRDGGRAEAAAIGRRAVLDFITASGTQAVSFAALLARIDACQTPSGRFSAVQYDAKFPAIVAA
jgi:hypothetical protein